MAGMKHILEATVCMRDQRSDSCICFPKNPSVKRPMKCEQVVKMKDRTKDAKIMSLL